MVRQLHDGIMARVTDNGAVSEAFAVTNGVRQGCVNVHTLFSLMFSIMLIDAYRDERTGNRIAYRMDGQLFNQRWMHLHSRDECPWIRIATEVTSAFSTVGVCRPKSLCLRLQSMTYSSRMTAP
ncbi:unnamed protein product [Schistocephalus solidus]|uniref:Reverse transcriptase domain-containing protein n=1 Tax=Schistocephalus solidus TaxID=70667 RepID=A0A183TKK2_SCHSO|nr:unnamed protein product [Schistocephalus solidus]